MRIYMVLIGLVVCGCVSQPTELTQKESDLDVYYEEPDRNYEDLGPIIAWSQYDQEQKAKIQLFSDNDPISAPGRNPVKAPGKAGTTLAKSYSVGGTWRLP